MLVTAIIGSYRKGNTYRIVRQMAERLAEHGVEVKYIFLSEANLQECRGCFTCLARGETLCPLKDDLSGIEKQLMESDGAILASPNFACGVTALMKRFIERFAYIGHRPRFFGKYAVTVATSGGPSGLKQTLQSLSYFAGGGYTIVSRLGLMTPPTLQSAKAAMKLTKKINGSADNLYQAMRDKRAFRPTFGSMMQFAAFRGMYLKNPVLGDAKFPADMKYWREMGWLDRKARHFQKGSIGIVNRAFGLLFEKVIGLAAARMKPDNAKAE